jgi:ABC-type ATPase with predicted acetyltransferase domain
VTKGNAFGSHKYAGKSALRYELGIDILVGNLVWIQGQYSAGKYTDIKIFNKVLRNFLEPGERVEADKGYRGHPDKSESGGESDDAGEGEGTSQDAERLAEELGILSQVFRHHITMHGDVYRACAVVSQLTVEK